MYLKGESRNQMQILCLESLVGRNSVVRIVDAFVDGLKLDILGFKNKGESSEGRPAYPNEILLKLYIYSYLNRVRSSRLIERETITNLEAIWLVKGLKPCYKTIADFRKVNARGLRKAFRQLNVILRSEGLFSADTVAVDGSKFRAQNSKKNNFNEKKIKRHIEYIDQQVDNYIKELDVLDSKEQEDEQSLEQRMIINDKCENLGERKKKYEQLSDQLAKAQQRGETQISTTDTDARSLPKKINIVEVSYNAIVTAEGKNKLITNFELTNELDSYALAKAARKAKVALGLNKDEVLTTLADKGFDTGHQLQECHKHNIDTLVGVKKRFHPTKHKSFNKNHFDYDSNQDHYICPAGEVLTTNGKWYKRPQAKFARPYSMKRYSCGFKVCNACEFKLDCAGQPNLAKSKGRNIERNQYQDSIDANINAVKTNKELYRKRQQWVEHQFGTIKRQWGYDYTLLKGKKKVAGEFSIIFLCYNLKRVINILGMDKALEMLRHLNSKIFTIRTAILSVSKALIKIIIYGPFAQYRNLSSCASLNLILEG